MPKPSRTCSTSDMSAIPASDLAEFMQLPDDVRADIEAWMQELRNVTKPIQKSLDDVAARLGVSAKTARRKWDAWRHRQCWRALVNRSKLPDERGLESEFLTYWQGLCKQNGRKC